MTNFAEVTPEVERACREVVHDVDVMAGVGDEPLDHMASEETKPSGHQDALLLTHSRMRT